MLNYLVQKRDKEDEIANEQADPHYGKFGENGELPVWNEQGIRLNVAEARGELEGWGLLSDEENISKAARKATKNERSKMEEKDRLYHRQVYHFMFSPPNSSRADNNPQKMLEIGQETARILWGKKGHRYILGIHEEKGHLHVHVMVKALPDHPPNPLRPQRLTYDKKDMQAARVVFSDVCNARGLETEATRRVDRIADRQKMLDGDSPERKRSVYDDRMKKSHWVADLNQRSPAWFCHFGAQYIDGHRAVALNHQPKKPPFHNPVKTGIPLVDYARATYQNPGKALQSFKALHQDDPRKAAWMMTKSPQSFGVMFQGADPPKLTKQMVMSAARRLDQVNLPNPDRALREAAAETVLKGLANLDSARRPRRAISNREFVAKNLTQLAKDYASDPNHNRTALARVQEAAKMSQAGIVSDFAKQAREAEPLPKPKTFEEQQRDPAEAVLTRRQRLSSSFSRQADARANEQQQGGGIAAPEMASVGPVASPDGSKGEGGAPTTPRERARARQAKMAALQRGGGLER
ncbi:relaxase/mobilization nuclease domain-containing protein [Magnetospira sp. QH-2]|uniref:relaxase/mobilization nuclease domain-containing protein n=1 Tax=Magnetospira sp. (strain QH-2) TaxID=1288970 RepID=UPI0003E817A6|nr:relaxase/mobilization nuclease domain-containing protein [Magnetospira sp. QH-2]CCQ75747.1 Protein of unknown function [Magnetospira sp. QH-2]